MRELGKLRTGGSMGRQIEVRPVNPDSTISASFWSQT
jgi:hypothetical protein